jgi:BMFP domain-containing protein YqiC
MDIFNKEEVALFFEAQQTKVVIRALIKEIEELKRRIEELERKNN